jgi:hypothetical protein
MSAFCEAIEPNLEVANVSGQGQLLAQQCEANEDANYQFERYCTINSTSGAHNEACSELNIDNALFDDANNVLNRVRTGNFGTWDLTSVISPTRAIKSPGNAGTLNNANPIISNDGLVIAYGDIIYLRQRFAEVPFTFLYTDVIPARSLSNAPSYIGQNYASQPDGSLIYINGQAGASDFVVLTKSQASGEDSFGSIQNFLPPLIGDFRLNTRDFSIINLSVAVSRDGVKCAVYGQYFEGPFVIGLCDLTSKNVNWDEARNIPDVIGFATLEKICQVEIQNNGDLAVVFLYSRAIPSLDNLYMFSRYDRNNASWDQRIVVDGYPNGFTVAPPVISNFGVDDWMYVWVGAENGASQGKFYSFNFVQQQSWPIEFSTDDLTVGCSVGQMKVADNGTIYVASLFSDIVTSNGSGFWSMFPLDEDHKLFSMVDECTLDDTNGYNISIDVTGNMLVFTQSFLNAGNTTWNTSMFSRDVTDEGVFITLFYILTVPGRHAILLDNGAVQVYTMKSTESTLLYDSKSGDGTFPTSTLISSNRFTWFTAESIPAYSPNGLYIVLISLTRPDAITIVNNTINSRAMQLNCELPGRQSDCYQTYETQYCDNMRTGLAGAEAYYDTRCFCMDEELILSTIFNVEVLKSNPVVYQQILAIAPCIASVCPSYKSEENIVGKFLRDVVECATEITICTSILTLGEGSEINGNVVTSLDCSNLSTGCAEGCPVGSVCDEKTNKCALSCTTNGECNVEQTCDVTNEGGGVCVTPGGGGGGGGDSDSSDLSVGAIIGIIVGVIVLIVAITLIVLWKNGKLSK